MIEHLHPYSLGDKVTTKEQALSVLALAPTFIKEELRLDLEAPDTRLFCERTGLYCIKGLNFATMQLDFAEDDSYVMTQNPYSSLYDEMLEVKEIEKLAGVTLEELEQQTSES